MTGLAVPAGGAPRGHAAPVPSSVLGMVLVVCVEVMFFAGLISAFTISRAGARPGVWQPPTSPLLPVEATAVNTAILLASGLLLGLAHRAYRRGRTSSSALLGASWLLGAAFVMLQGREWMGLLAEGLTLRSSPLGAFFYLIVGAHALHAVLALGVLAACWRRLSQGRLTSPLFLAAQTFWYFVVGMWPVIYGRVYF